MTMTITRYNDKYRPQFHFTPEENWMNDPNGMVYFNEEYHLFYQYHPHGTTWGPMHWGHAVSKDLVHWENLPIALYPDAYGDIFSGSAVVDWSNTTGFFDDSPGLVAIYTNAGTYPDSERPRQRQSLAYSKDDGRTWIKYEGNPVLSDESIVDYRDPKVFWHSETSQWVMILATGQTVNIYTSSDLKDWEHASEFGNNQGSHDGVWECPDLFKLSVDGDEKNQKWVMIVSIGDNGEFNEGSRTQYFIGDFDGKTFTNNHSEDTVLWLDYGRDNYAGVSWSDVPSEDGRRIYIAWMSNWRYANEVPTEKWRSAMTLPRELTLKTTGKGIRINQNPVKEIEAIRHDTVSQKDIMIKDNKEKAYAIEGLSEVEIELENLESDAFGMMIENSKEEKTVIRFDVKKEVLVVDRTESGDNSFSASFAAVQEAPLNMVDNKIRLQVFIDASSIEVFGNDGEVAVTQLIFPKEPVSRLTLYSVNGSVKVNEIKVTELESIWNKDAR